MADQVAPMNPADKSSAKPSEDSPRKNDASVHNDARQPIYDGTAVVLAPGTFTTDKAKTAHGLVRGSDRFRIVGVIDPSCAGRDAGELLDGNRRDIPILATLADALLHAPSRPDTCIVGTALGGGMMSPQIRALLLEAAEAGLNLVNGLHELASDDPQITAAVTRHGRRIVDLRRPRPLKELRFWNGDIAQVRAPRIAVLGTDCSLGKRTTARLLVAACRAAGLRAEMIYTGQTGWMQGGRYGFVLDATPNDFVAGELEGAIVKCDAEAAPDVIVIEGQSALRNPSGPCGAELLVSAGARAAILQHAPGRACFKGLAGWTIPSLDEEIELVRLYGAQVLAIALNGDGVAPAALAEEARRLEATLAVPVVRPLAKDDGGLAGLIPQVRRYLTEPQGNRVDKRVGRMPP
jgi:uncharacterized NAD-dependent epimerase/dehydratase family protein